MKVLALGRGEVALQPVIRGLVAEAATVRNLLESGEYDAVALSVSPEELDTLRANPGVRASPANAEEEIYMEGLSRFGEVRKPPPCFTEAVRVAGTHGIALEPLDLDEEAFADAYAREVSGVEMVRYSLGLKRLRRLSFPSSSPEAFLRAFDDAVNRLRGHRRLERAREGHMAKALEGLSRKHRRLLALVERERMAGVVDALQRLR